MCGHLNACAPLCLCLCTSTLSAHVWAPSQYCASTLVCALMCGERKGTRFYPNTNHTLIKLNIDYLQHADVNSSSIDEHWHGWQINTLAWCTHTLRRMRQVPCAISSLLGHTCMFSCTAPTALTLHLHLLWTRSRNRHASYTQIAMHHIHKLPCIIRRNRHASYTQIHAPSGRAWCWLAAQIWYTQTQPPVQAH